ncbi:hypothetical protein ACFUCQ_03985 [Streptomyces sp. NPDC057197]|uniref:hypothetical protein n=1 Tax=unclassified Streptomyces TaxID=2593676 RepID=UPI0033AF97D3
MNKPMRRLVTTGIAAVAASGAFMAGAGSAAAATSQPAGCPGPAPVTTAHAAAQRSAPHRHIDRWVLDQLRLFDPAAAHRLAIYDPWVKDQLAQFAGQLADK